MVMKVYLDPYPFDEPPTTATISRFVSDSIGLDAVAQPGLASRQASRILGHAEDHAAVLSQVIEESGAVRPLDAKHEQARRALRRFYDLNAPGTPLWPAEYAPLRDGSPKVISGLLALSKKCVEHGKPLASLWDSEGATDNWGLLFRALADREASNLSEAVLRRATTLLRQEVAAAAAAAAANADADADADNQAEIHDAEAPEIGRPDESDDIEDIFDEIMREAVRAAPAPPVVFSPGVNHGGQDDDEEGGNHHNSGLDLGDDFDFGATPGQEPPIAPVQQSSPAEPTPMPTPPPRARRAAFLLAATHITALPRERHQAAPRRRSQAPVVFSGSRQPSSAAVVRAGERVRASVLQVSRIRLPGTSWGRRARAAQAAMDAFIDAMGGGDESGDDITDDDDEADSDDDNL
jgi:hypothetical protein